MKSFFFLFRVFRWVLLSNSVASKNPMPFQCRGAAKWAMVGGTWAMSRLVVAFGDTTWANFPYPWESVGSTKVVVDGCGWLWMVILILRICVIKCLRRPLFESNRQRFFEANISQNESTGYTTDKTKTYANKAYQKFQPLLKTMSSDSIVVKSLSGILRTLTWFKIEVLEYMRWHWKMAKQKYKKPPNSLIGICQKLAIHLKHIFPGTSSKQMVC